MTSLSFAWNLTHVASEFNPPKVPGGTVITNTTAVSFDGPDADTSDNVATATITVARS